MGEQVCDRRLTGSLYFLSHWGNAGAMTCALSFTLGAETCNGLGGKHGNRVT